MPGIFEAVLLLLGLGAAVFIGGELWRESRRKAADRENLDRLADGGVDRTVTMASRERTAPMSRELTFPLGGAEKTAPITDEGLINLGKLTKLKSLDIYSHRITDAGLLHLRGLTKLESLTIDGKQITDLGLAELQKVLPNCKIDR